MPCLKTFHRGCGWPFWKTGCWTTSDLQSFSYVLKRFAFVQLSSGSDQLSDPLAIMAVIKEMFWDGNPHHPADYHPGADNESKR